MDNDLVQRYTDALINSVDIITQQKLQGLGYDKTVLLTITDDLNRRTGKYIVSDGNITFSAYSDDSSLREGDQVYVLIPEGDFSQEKTIVRKKNTVDGFIDVNPLEDLISYHSLYEYTQEKGLYTNADAGSSSRRPEESYVLIGSITDIDNSLFKKYDYFGISSEFKNFLGGKVSSGDYGLQLDFYSNEELFSTVKFSTTDMFGNVYNFNGYILQKKIFQLKDISQDISRIEIKFYQSGNFKTADGEYYKVWDDNGNIIIPPNLYCKNIKLNLGLSKSELEEDKVVVYIEDNAQKRYEVTDSAAELKRELKCQWFHINPDTKEIIEIDSNNLSNYGSVAWYRFDPESSGSEGGVHWVKIGGNGLIQEVNLDITKSECSYKAICKTLDGIIYTSNETIFLNISDIQNGGNIITATGYSLHFNDGSGGYYYLYDNMDKLLQNVTMDSYVSGDGTLLKRGVELYYNGKPIIESAIDFYDVKFLITTLSDSNDSVIKLGESIEIGEKVYGIYYALPISYSNLDNIENNKIICTFKVRNTDKETDIEDIQIETKVSLGHVGANGTNYSLSIGFNNDITFNKRLKDEGILEIDDYYDTINSRWYNNNPGANKSFTWFHPVLYDPSGKMVDFYRLKGGQGYTIKWSIISNNANETFRYGNSSYGTNGWRIQKSNDNYWFGFSVDTNTGIDISLLLKLSIQIPDVNYTLVSIMPLSIALRNFSENLKYTLLGPKTISYNSAGEPLFDGKKYRLFKGEELQEASFTLTSNSGIFSLVDNTLKASFLVPNNTGEAYEYSYNGNTFTKVAITNVFIETLKATVGGNVVYAQSIYGFQNKYFSNAINEWDGSLQIDSAGNKIMAASYIAGTKTNNLFTGVIMGDLSKADGTAKKSGLFGYKNGINTFSIDTNGNAVFAGELSAATGSFAGDISAATGTFKGGLQVGSNFKVDGTTGKMTASEATISGTITSNNVNITGGKLSIGNNFSVTNTGNLTAKSVDIDGGDLNFGNGKFHVDSSGNLTANAGTFAGSLNGATGTFAGNLSAAGGSFEGDISAASGTFTGGISSSSVTITGGSFDIGSGQFKVTSSGALTAKSATITGNITANSLTIAEGAEVSNLYAGQIYIDGETLDTVIRSKVNAAGARSASNISIEDGRYIFAGRANYASQAGSVFFEAQGAQNLLGCQSNTGGSYGAVYYTSKTVSSISSGSTKRIKHDIIDLNFQEKDKIYSLMPKTFYYNEGYDDGEPTMRYGFIAEDIQPLMPGAVWMEGENKELCGGIRYENLTTLAIAEIQQIRKELDEIKEKVNNG